MARVDEDHEILFGEHSGLDVVAQCAAQSTVGSRRYSEIGLARPNASRASAVGISRSITRSPGYSLSMDSTASGSQTNDGPIVAPFHPVGDYAASGIIAERSRSAAEGECRSGSARRPDSLARTCDTPTPSRLEFRLPASGIFGSCHLAALTFSNDE
jgi:hypothetical protein